MSQKKHLAILALTAVIFIDNIGFGLIFPILSPLLMDPVHGMLGTGVTQGIRDLDFGLILGVFAVCMFFSAPILGDYSDQLGRRKVIIFCLAGTAVAAIVCAIAITFKLIILLAIGRMLNGIFAGSQPVAQAAMADISSGEDRAKNLGLIGAAGSAGFVIGPIIGGYFSDSQIVHWFNYATPFYIDAIITVLNALLLFFTFKETYISKKHLSLNFIKGIQIFAQAFVRKSIRKLSGILLLLELTFALYFQFIGFYLLSKFHFSPSQLGMFMSLSGAIFALTLGVLMRFIIKLTDKKTIIIAGLIITAVGYLLPVFIETALMQWIALFPILIGIGMAYNALLAAFSNSVSEHEQGWVMGITSGVMAMSWILGAIGAGLFFYLDPALPYIMAVIFILISMVIAGFIKIKM